MDVSSFIPHFKTPALTPSENLRAAPQTSHMKVFY